MSLIERMRAGYTAGAVCAVLGVIALVTSWATDGQLRAVAGVASGVLCCAGLGLAALTYRRQLDAAG